MTPSEMQAVLSDGFTGKNLLAVAEGCTDCSEASRFPAALLVLETVCGRVGDWWDENPVSTKEAEETEALLSHVITDLVEALHEGDPESVNSKTTPLADAYRRWRA